MNARGNTEQWGTEPWTGSREREAVIGELAHGGGMRIAEAQDGTVQGALVITSSPQRYVPAADEEELYVTYMVQNILKAKELGCRLAGVGDNHRRNLQGVFELMDPDILVMKWTEFYADPVPAPPRPRLTPRYCTPSGARRSGSHGEHLLAR